ncbi:MAG: hypothetical protein Q8Q26_12735 [Pseudorhodobacter sp.]|nr:hypothetical protein [Pseudorhodobacter sp.]
MATVQSEISRLEQANKLGLEFFKTAILLNGGAVLALLTFVGNISENSVVQFALTNIKVSMCFFLIGIASILLTLIVSYSYTATAPEFRYHQYWDRHIIPLNTVLGLVSLTAFVIGVSSLILGANAP